MARFIRRLLNAFFPAKTPQEVEIQRNERALLRYQVKRDALIQRFFDDDMPCCPTCAFPEIDDLGEKMDRVEKQLTALRKKTQRVDVSTPGGTW